METIKKFVVIGPESTGKSTLCTQLAEYYKTIWVPEYAREYLEKNGTEYSYDDLLTIAKGQIDLEESFDKLRMTNSLLSVTHPSPLLFIDTDMYVMKVWCEFVFNKCHNWILNRIAGRGYDGYLLCDTDLPWVKDNLREYPDVGTRNKLYHFYKDLLINQSVPWVDISGSYEERFEKAILFINALTEE
ncbi:ATP-binding protein [Ginsengibacter hankyongi]|uniref:ATP-binding protein n=1 Tax=Ginsengibacter hankyongi TaxID=2607284 RepID=A0A5J5IPN5_9BACT|nr:ATP-binding protein [Ginsengibacter hankyongi]KAA9041954.1 ATP-binding protein [Ginsengibacter hankyongi]